MQSYGAVVQLGKKIRPMVAREDSSASHNGREAVRDEAVPGGVLRSLARSTVRECAHMAKYCHLAKYHCRVLTMAGPHSRVWTKVKPHSRVQTEARLYYRIARCCHLGWTTARSTQLTEYCCILQWPSTLALLVLQALQTTVTPCTHVLTNDNVASMRHCDLARC
jgi:hypothetical protein